MAWHFPPPAQGKPFEGTLTRQDGEGKLKLRGVIEKDTIQVDLKKLLTD